MLSRVGRHISVVRTRKSLPYLQKKTVNDFSSEEEFQDAVDIATLRKGKPQLYHFEDVIPESSRIYPNDKFKFLHNPEKWKSHEQYYEAAQEERLLQLSQYHPEDWSLDHDHRLTWFGMSKMQNEGLGELNEWWIGEKREERLVNIGFKRRSEKILKRKSTKAETMRIKRAIMKGEHEINSVEANRPFMRSNGRISMMDACQEPGAHYNIQRDQFGSGRFDAIVRFGVNFDSKVASFCGNELTPADCANKPTFSIDAPMDQLFTVTISSLDSNYLEDGLNELLHYAVSNVNSGEENEWQQYLPPIPAKGSGYHRLVFTLYHQSQPISVEPREANLKGRQFDSRQFLIDHQETLTPAGFTFSQVRWDESVRQTFHKVLEMPEPVYEYPKQDVFPFERPEGLPAGAEINVIESWYPKEKQYPRRTRAELKKPKLKMTNYLGYDIYRNYLGWREKSE